MAKDLKILQQNRKDILLAEVAAWLHDWKKCSDEHLKVVLWTGFQNCQNEFVRSCPSFTPSPAQGLPNADFTGRFFPSFSSSTISLCTISISIEDLVNKGRRGAEDYSLSPLIYLLRKAHHVAHMEKELENCELDGLQCTHIPKASSGFGFEGIEIYDLTNKLEQVGISVQNRKFIFTLLRSLWQVAIGDTRRPINEITLWDWSSIVAALYKAEIARCVLGGKHEPNQITWRLLSLRTDGLGYMLSAPSIPDLLVRKELLTDAWNRVQKVLEEDYPLGLEVYRDENGPVFVVPDLDDLLELENPDDNHKTLREYILEAFRQDTVKEDTRLAIDGEVVPVFKLDDKPWKGQPAPAELPPIGKHLKQIPPIQADPASIAKAWSNFNCTEEICSVCGLRPQGPGPKARSRKMCDICEERRADRAKAWAEGTALSSEERFLRGKPDTIWVDEVADKNGRIALIVGKFDLTHWLDGTLVRSLAVRTPNDQNGHTEEKVAKNPSFARLRRIWETTRRFWQEVAPTDAPPQELQDFCNRNGLSLRELWEGPLSLEASGAGQAIAEKRPRIFLKAEKDDKLAQRLGPFHAYEMEVQGRKVAVLWVPEDAKDGKGDDLKYRGGFWVIENLDYLKGLFGKPFKQVLEEGTSYDIYEPSEYGRPARVRVRFTLAKKETNAPVYTPLIPILAEPSTFMALAPADKAFEIVKAIRIKYEQQMGKVRNRLPLHIGIVFANRKMPLWAILDAGKRMLEQRSFPILWEVICPARKQVSRGDILQNHFEKEGQFKEWYEILMKSGKRSLIWYVPALMGDGETEDNWYPYAFLASLEEPEGRKRYYKTHLSNPWRPDHSWLVHAGDLQPGDKIYFTPATFDFEFLDVNVKRFEIFYDKLGRRKGSLTRPYLLDEITELEKIWNFLAKEPVENGKSRLSSSQILGIRNKIEEKREEWFENPEDSLNDSTFKELCQGLFVNAPWRGGKPKKGQIKWLAEMAINGYFTDAVYLYHHVMKEKPAGEE